MPCGILLLLLLLSSHQVAWKANLDFPVDGSDQPRQSKTKKHVDRVGSGHISNRIIGSVVHRRRLLTGKQVRQTGAQRHERNGCDAVLEADQTAKDARQVTDDGRQQAD